MKNVNVVSDCSSVPLGTSRYPKHETEQACENSYESNFELAVPRQQIQQGGRHHQDSHSNAGKNNANEHVNAMSASQVDVLITAFEQLDRRGEYTLRSISDRS